ncbi:MAG TPA: site-2 protease family protein [Candidatus Limnocylindria bacterium]|nr:site-2 protease family protein [Candidatus Limnocylindria bacterium]
MPGSFRIARVLGIDIRVHISWVLIFFLVLLSLADQVFPASYPQWSQQKTFIVSAIAALLFFGSVLLHELAHAIVALRFKMSVSSITLFLLGGVANLTKEPPSAKAEFLMAGAGPLTSLVIGGLGLLVQQLVVENIDRLPALQPVEAVAGYLGFINIAVAVFNLVPGFPLDGGRVLRSVIWGLRRDRVAATRIAARGGQLVAGLMVVYAGSRVLEGEAMSGLWMGLIAYFLYGAASQALQHERVSAAVGSVRVGQLMTTDFRSAPAGISIGQLIRDVVLPHNLQAIPVVHGDRLAGLISIGDLRKVEQDHWGSTPVDEVMTPASELPTVSPDEQLVSALDRFGGGDLPLLPVVDRDRLVGVLHRESVVGYVRMREMLGFDARR